MKNKSRSNKGKTEEKEVEEKKKVGIERKR